MAHMDAQMDDGEMADDASSEDTALLVETETDAVDAGAGAADGVDHVRRG